MRDLQFTWWCHTTCFQSYPGRFPTGRPAALVDQPGGRSVRDSLGISSIRRGSGRAHPPEVSRHLLWTTTSELAHPGASHTHLRGVGTRPPEVTTCDSVSPATRAANLDPLNSHERRVCASTVVRLALPMSHSTAVRPSRVPMSPWLVRCPVAITDMFDLLGWHRKYSQKSALHKLRKK